MATKYPIVVDDKSAEKEIERLFERFAMLPLRAEALREMAVPFIKQGIQVGLVTIEDDGSIKQKLMVPVDSMDHLVYSGNRIPAKTMRTELAKLKEVNASNKANLYIRMYTGKLQAQLDGLETEDRNIAESIALFLY